MPYYITYGEFQKQMTNFYRQYGKRLQFTEMTDYLYRKGLLQETLEMPHVSGIFENMSDDEFEETIDSFVLSLTPQLPPSSSVVEADIIPPKRDVFIIRHPQFTRPNPHTHNFFEINYVVRGSCRFTFEDEISTLQEGELCIIAPSSSHDILIEDQSIVYTIMLRKSSFDTIFFSLLSGKDLLSYFFRKILQDDTSPNFLLFKTDQNDELKAFIRNAMVECHRYDSYSNSSCINWINLMFTNLLRNYSESMQFHNYHIGTDFSVILQYIQHHYQELSLSSLAEEFHYSEPYLSTMIRENTGYNFTDLVRRLRLAHAIEYLENSNLKISEIAAQVGYKSTDHFSRVFRTTYQISPVQYRKQHHHSEESFNPFI